ncbi:MAG TPA: universal stress protein [Chloroflexota bacterium]|nr:universal stress protein [Chloroflexota bacterium]
MKILVALDGSEKDKALLARVGALARASQAELLLVHALNPWADPGEATGLTGLLLGSTAQALLRLSPCPVLVVRPDGAAAGHENTASAGATPEPAVPALAA